MQNLWQIFRAPLLLALLSMAGLLAALLADGPGDVASWLCLGCIAFTGIACSFKKH